MTFKKAKGFSRGGARVKGDGRFIIVGHDASECAGLGQKR